MRTQNQAQYEAEQALAKMTIGKGLWKIRVHENIGWHWNLVLEGGNFIDCGGRKETRSIKLCLSVTGKFFAMIGGGVWGENFHHSKQGNIVHSDPNEAVRHEYNRAKQESLYYRAYVEDFRNLEGL